MFDKYTNPNTCASCPYKHSKEGCPAWIGPENGFMETNEMSGEERLVTGCFYPIMIRLMQHVVKAANRPAAAMESMRNEMVRGLGKVAKAIGFKPLPALEKLDAERE